jgi:hypothetical protein
MSPGQAGDLSGHCLRNLRSVFTGAGFLRIDGCVKHAYVTAEQCGVCPGPGIRRRRPSTKAEALPLRDLPVLGQGSGMYSLAIFVGCCAYILGKRHIANLKNNDRLPGTQLEPTAALGSPTGASGARRSLRGFASDEL